MKKTITFLSIIIHVTLYSQKTNYNYKAIYKYEFQIDSLNIHSKLNEDMILLVNSSKSFYYSTSRFAIDNLVRKYPNASLPELLLLRKTIPKNKVKIEIEKDFIHSNINYYEKIAQTIFITTIKTNFNWEIINQEKKINGYNCKKAIMKFKGRNYVAWYSKDIPISNGPYKFGGLPGLIIEIYDSKKHHYFILKEFKKEYGPFPNYSKLPFKTSIKKIIQARKSQFSNSNFSFTTDPILIKKAKNRLKKRNNPIELDNK